MDGMLSVLDNPNYKNGDTNDNLLTTTELTVKPVKGLEIKGNFTYGLNQYRNYNRSTNTSYSRYPGEIITLNSGNSIDRLQEIIETQHYFATNLFATYEHPVNSPPPSIQISPNPIHFGSRPWLSHIPQSL